MHLVNAASGITEVLAPSFPFDGMPCTISSPYTRVATCILRPFWSAFMPQVIACYWDPKLIRWETVLACPFRAIKKLAVCYTSDNHFICISDSGKITTVRIEIEHLLQLPRAASQLLTILSGHDLETFSGRIALEASYSTSRRMLLALRGTSAANLLDRLIPKRDYNVIPSASLRLIQDISSSAEELPLSLWVPENEITVDPFGDLGHGGEARVFRCERNINGWRWPMAVRKAVLTASYTRANAYREALTHYLLSHKNILRLYGVFFHHDSFMTLLPLVENQYSSRSCLASSSPSASSLHFLRSVHHEGRRDLVPVTLKSFKEQQLGSSICMGGTHP
ncbi:hypothetical protein DL93DRAFT_1680346 [Clavulina sp. PMI_390]|nr:hypothetical protein DL93DRAFT_1680346 [Clavulina sp. PMI_390]